MDGRLQHVCNGNADMLIVGHSIEIKSKTFAQDVFQSLIRFVNPSAKSDNRVLPL